jgi:uncharacterized protein YjiS (DUF1127 family)
MAANLFLTWIRRAQVRSHLRHSVGDLLSRQDDHLLNDIGLTRYQAEQLVDEPPFDDAPTDGPSPKRAVPSVHCETC